MVVDGKCQQVWTPERPSRILTAIAMLWRSFWTSGLFAPVWLKCGKTKPKILQSSSVRFIHSRVSTHIGFLRPFICTWVQTPDFTIEGCKQEILKSHLWVGPCLLEWSLNGWWAVQDVKWKDKSRMQWILVGLDTQNNVQRDATCSGTMWNRSTAAGLLHQWPARPSELLILWSGLALAWLDGHELVATIGNVSWPLGKPLQIVANQVLSQQTLQILWTSQNHFEPLYWHMRWLSTMRICSTLAWESPFSLPFSWCPAAPRLGWEGGARGLVVGCVRIQPFRWRQISAWKNMPSVICLQMGGTWWDNVVHVSFEWAKVAKD